MSKKIKNKKIFYIILLMIPFTLIGVVYAASSLISSSNVKFDNSTNGMKATNAQDAVDELYNQCKDAKNKCPEGYACKKISSFNDLKMLTVTSGDGLYADATESGKYFYRGKSPNNYVKFNNELWRILSINSDGTIKIVKDGYYSTSKAWDTSGGAHGSNNWARPADLNTELNSTYYNSLSTTAQNMINTSTWDIGGTGWVDKQTIAEDVATEKATTWTGKIALFTVSEYIRTNSNIACHTGPDDYYDGANGNPGYNTCKNTTWLYNSSNYQWSLSPNSDYSYYVWYANPDGSIRIYDASGGTYAVRPALNLKSNIQITSGKGTSSEPFNLTN